MPRWKEREVLAFVLYFPQHVAGAPFITVEYLLDVLGTVSGALSQPWVSLSSRSGKLSGLIPVSVLASRDRDGDHGAQQAPRVGGQHLHAGAEHHRWGEERRHGLGECAVEQVGGPAWQVGYTRADAGEGCPQASLASEVLLSLWDEEMGSAVRVGALAGVPPKDNPGPLPTTQMVSSASQPSHLASCLSFYFTPWSPRESALLQRHGDGADTQHSSTAVANLSDLANHHWLATAALAHSRLGKRMSRTWCHHLPHLPTTKHCNAGPCFKGYGRACNLIWPFLEDPGSSVWVSLSHSFSATHMAIPRACPHDSARMIKCCCPPLTWRLTVYFSDGLPQLHALKLSRCHISWNLAIAPSLLE